MDELRRTNSPALSILIAVSLGACSVAHAVYDRYYTVVRNEIVGMSSPPPFVVQPWAFDACVVALAIYSGRKMKVLADPQRSKRLPVVLFLIAIACLFAAWCWLLWRWLAYTGLDGSRSAPSP